jgi:hypothetical protein
MRFKNHRDHRIFPNKRIETRLLQQAGDGDQGAVHRARRRRLKSRSHWPDPPGSNFYLLAAS